MDIKNVISSAGNQISNITKSILNEIKPECDTYNDLTKKLKQLKSDYRWENNFICVQIIDWMIKSVEEEKGNSKISNRL